MNKILIIIAFMIFSMASFAQKLEYVNGLYYKKGMLYTGLYVEHDENGKLLIEQNIRNGLEHGIVTLYFPSGSKKEQREFNEGKKTGTWITWNEQGLKVAEAGYKDGIKHGAWYIWDNNRTLLYEMFYNEGAKTGLWRQWDETGKLIMERKYE